MTRADTLRLLKEHGLRPKRSLGQNFLLDGNFLDAIVRDAEIGPHDDVVEIGSGPGNLTERLASKARHVWAFEVDRDLHAFSREVLKDLRNITWIHADGAELEKHLPAGRRFKAVSNLPYFDYERLLLALLSSRCGIESCTLMVQTDVYERLRAKPGTREYGPFPVLLQAGCAIEFLRRAGRKLFYPVPRVESTLLRLVPSGAVKPEEWIPLLGQLRLMFAHRRKKASHLHSELGDDRVEALSAERLLASARRLRPV